MGFDVTNPEGILCKRKRSAKRASFDAFTAAMISARRQRVLLKKLMFVVRNMIKLLDSPTGKQPCLFPWMIFFVFAKGTV